ncbi:hypothetical protein C8R41DRAFT_126172 [Lentinula lateritia]|uniref:Uncharacterized protein n=1 Tax=Lentinula lateritia TaxID=40482 RepID=A0ABQ8VQV9_9AGAR|nr:hypothetical protein C8R41DRAFT_126172 [Lentinula lateritia]
MELALRWKKTLVATSLTTAHNFAHDRAHNFTHDRAPNFTHDRAPNFTHDRAPNFTHDRAHDCTLDFPHDSAPNPAPDSTHDFAPSRAHNSTPNRTHNFTPDSAPNPIHDPAQASNPDSIYDDAHGTPSHNPGCGSIREAAHCSAQDPGRNSAHSSSQEAAHDCGGHVSTPSCSHNSDCESSYELAHHPRNSSQASVYSSTHARYLCYSQDTAQDPTLKINEAFSDDQGEAEGPLLANTIYPAPSEADNESLLDHDTLLADSHRQNADDPNPLLDELLEELLNSNNHYQEKMILCSDLDAAILSLLEDACSRPLVNSPTRQTGSCTSHFATSNEDPGSCKRRRL